MTTRSKANTEPMPDVQKVLVYYGGLEEAVARMGRAWNTKQLVEAINSAKYWIGVMEDGLQTSK